LNMLAKRKIQIAGLVFLVATLVVIVFPDLIRSGSTDDRFVTEATFNSNLDKQIQMIPGILDQLRRANVTSDKALKLEYFFYTNTAEKAERLAAEIAKLNYSVRHGVSAGDQNLFVVTGWTTKIEMKEEVIQQWTRQMSELGYTFDCEFDGWGTDAGSED